MYSFSEMQLVTGPFVDIFFILSSLFIIVRVNTFTFTYSPGDQNCSSIKSTEDVNVVTV